MTDVLEPERRTRVRAHVDVVVCGGGPAGVGAAFAAARAGANTLVVEHYGCLGGCATSGMLNRLGPYHDQEKMIVGGIPFEILERLVKLDAAIMPRPGPWGGVDGPNADYWAPFDPETLKFVLDTMAEEAGVSVLFDTKVAGAIVASGKVQGVFIESKSGREAILAKVVIDATGDGDVAASAGAAYEQGRPADGLTQPIGLFSKVHNLGRDEAVAFLEQHRQEMLREAEGRGETVPRPVFAGYGAGSDNLLRADETYYNADHVHGADATNVAEISRAWVEARKQIWQSYGFAKRNVPGYERAYIAATGAMLGVRESRRVLGEYVLTGDDVLASRKFPDAIARYACYIDVHAVGSPGQESTYNRKSPQAGTSYDIPYRCLVPQEVENLLVAGRCFSATHEALASARMIPCCMAMGQAAGTAAALAAGQGTPPRKVEVAALRQSLLAQGVSLDL
ncbi:MAG: FAD-dependent oxidoreductase [Armatimonadia bacterium]